MKKYWANPYVVAKVENDLRAEGRSEDFIAGARWSWDTTAEALKIFFEMKESFK